MARIAIVGPGAIGGVIAAWLSHTGRHEVILCARRPLSALTVETPGKVIVADLTVLTDPKQATAVDWVLVATKTYDTEGAASWFAGLVKSETSVAILQNGVEHRERFAPYLSPDRIVPVVVDIPSERVEPTHIRQRGRGKLVAPDDARGQKFLALFEGTEFERSATADFKTAAWRKLCINSAGVVSGLLLQPAGVMRDPKIAEIAGGLIRECIAVGRAEGAEVGEELVESVLAGYRASAPDGINSLHADRLAGRQTEIDARNGVIVRRGKSHGIATPYNQMAVALITAMTHPPTVGTKAGS